MGNESVRCKTENIFLLPEAVHQFITDLQKAMFAEAVTLAKLF